MTCSREPEENNKNQGGTHEKTVMEKRSANQS